MPRALTGTDQIPTFDALMKSVNCIFWLIPMDQPEMALLRWSANRPARYLTHCANADDLTMITVTMPLCRCTSDTP
jgi:hypothetical protein